MSQNNGYGDSGEDDLEKAQVVGKTALETSEEEQEPLVTSPNAEAVKPAVAEEVKPAAAPKQEEEARCLGLPMTGVSLVSLTVQTSGGVLLIRWAFAENLEARFLTTTCVFFTEMLKVFVSLILVIQESGSLSEAGRSIHEHFTSSPSNIFKSTVPALIYTIQNNLMFYSLEKLSGPVQQVLYQMKILTTAGMGVLMLGKSLTWTQWSSLVILVAGIALVQWPRNHNTSTPSLSSDSLKGFVAVMCACLTSGFAGVFIQKMLQQSSCTLWMRNIQFGLFGAVCAIIVAFSHDGEKINELGFTQGYSRRVVLVICINAWGGIAAAVMLKYAGATLGCFSTAISIILTSILSQLLFADFVADALFGVGASLATASTLLYGLGLPAKLVNCFDAGKVAPGTA